MAEYQGQTKWSFAPAVWVLLMVINCAIILLVQSFSYPISASEPPLADATILDIHYSNHGDGYILYEDAGSEVKLIPVKKNYILNRSRIETEDAVIIPEAPDPYTIKIGGMFTGSKVTIAGQAEISSMTPNLALGIHGRKMDLAFVAVIAFILLIAETVIIDKIRELRK